MKTSGSRSPLPRRASEELLDLAFARRHRADVLDRLGPDSRLVGWTVAAHRFPNPLHVPPDVSFAPNRFAVLYRSDAALFKDSSPRRRNDKGGLCDLVRDGGEVRNLIDEQPALARAPRDKVRSYRAEAVAERAS